MHNPPLALTRRGKFFFGGKCLEIGSFQQRLRFIGNLLRLATRTFDERENILEAGALDFFQD
jgi:hypothetical protein